MFAQQIHGAQQQIVKIERAGLAQNLVVDAEDLGSMLARFVAGLGGAGGHLVGSDAVIFCVADLRAHAARRIIVGGKIELRERAFHRGGLVVVIVNGKIARQAEVVRLAAQQARAERMKGRDPDVRSVAARRAQQVADALLHHAGGFVGERDGENRAARNAHFDQVRDAIGDDARLAGARAGQNQQGTFGCEHSFALAFVQFVEKCCG